MTAYDQIEDYVFARSVAAQIFRRRSQYIIAAVIDAWPDAGAMADDEFYASLVRKRAGLAPWWLWLIQIIVRLIILYYDTRDGRAGIDKAKQELKGLI